MTTSAPNEDVWSLPSNRALRAELASLLCRCLPARNLQRWRTPPRPRTFRQPAEACATAAGCKQPKMAEVCQTDAC